MTNLHRRDFIKALMLTASAPVLDRLPSLREATVAPASTDIMLPRGSDGDIYAMIDGAWAFVGVASQLNVMYPVNVFSDSLFGLSLESPGQINAEICTDHDGVKTISEPLYGMCSRCELVKFVVFSGNFAMEFGGYIRSQQFNFHPSGMVTYSFSASTFGQVTVSEIEI